MNINIPIPTYILYIYIIYIYIGLTASKADIARLYLKYTSKLVVKERDGLSFSPAAAAGVSILRPQRAVCYAMGLTRYICICIRIYIYIGVRV